ncbi:hypothetical protein A3F45_01415 [Candidatus Curtissbacteria bacterium RIFCSPHIGHO2_12_FULL_41_17]|uniref:Uncharacterized protein n=2 Tax=Candidatus Curtissiibacteriota TaxID=1752717 RepID=A0A1F5HLF1_9BACT|nr:MAG: hypothetical protein A2693_02030 [Candidatus Curtissbacteria bacterium RIFCSPHIGHO2_01_FULL_40_12]OGE04875.1 MAG: hypothetical protein A3F45_01415 [Candidatus Curtissbacteria bacterium RIFCSPHIGHO2_12_FULL_41_17]
MAVEQQTAYESFGQFRARVTRELSFAQRKLVELTDKVVDDHPEGISVLQVPNTDYLTYCANQIRLSFYPDRFQIMTLPRSVKDVLLHVVDESRDLEVTLVLDDPESSEYGYAFGFSFALVLGSRIAQPDKVSIGVSSLDRVTPFVVRAQTEDQSEEQRRIIDEYRKLGITDYGKTHSRAVLAEGARWAGKIIAGEVDPKIVDLETYRRNRPKSPSFREPGGGLLLRFPKTA